MEEYEIPPQRAEADVKKFVSDLVSFGLAEP